MALFTLVDALSVTRNGIKSALSVVRQQLYSHPSTLFLSQQSLRFSPNVHFTLTVFNLESILYRIVIDNITDMLKLQGHDGQIIIIS